MKSKTKTANDVQKKISVTKTKYYAKGNDWYQVLLPERTYKDVYGNDVYYPAICVTTDYAKIQKTPGQRDLKSAHIKELYNSIVELNSVNREIIVVKYNNEYTNVDGLHLYTAEMQLGLPIEFKLIEVTTLKEAVAIMRKMNSTSRNWTIRQFVNSTALINKDYARLKKYYESNDITMNLMCGLFYNIQKFNPAKANNTIKDGTFQMNTSIKDIDLFIKRIRYFYTMTNLKNTQYCTWGLISFIIEKNEIYGSKEKIFLAKVKETAHKRKHTDKSFGERQEYVDFFTECWNDL